MNFLNLKHLDQVDPVPVEMVFEYLGASIVLGIILMIIAVWSGRLLSGKYPKKDKSGGIIAAAKDGYAELILGSANVMFLCFGMTGIMILVANNLARAFAIGAAMAIVRFRIKFDSKGLGSTFLFGILVGMACGVGQVPTAVGITVAFGLLQMIIVMLVTLAAKKEAATAQATAQSNPARPLS